MVIFGFQVHDLFKFIGLYEFKIQTYIIILTNKYGTSNVQVPNVATIKIEADDNNVLVMSNSNNDICIVVDLSYTPLLSYMARTPIPLLVSMGVDITNYSLSNLKLACHRFLSQHPPLHISSYSTCLNIVYTLKLTKFRIMSKFNLTTIDFHNIDVCDIKYLPPSFKGYVQFVLFLPVWLSPVLWSCRAPAPLSPLGVPVVGFYCYRSF